MHKVILASSVLFAAALHLLAQIPVTSEQSFNLQRGWNLISFQVTPTNPDPGALFAGLVGFQSAWHYDTSTELWQVYVKPSGTVEQQASDSISNSLFGLASIQTGNAYWICMDQAAEWRVPGILPIGQTFPSLRLVTGWNMVGFPVGASSLPADSKVGILAVLTAVGLDYDAVFTWEASPNSSFKKMFRVAEKPDSGNPPVPSLALVGSPSDPPFPNYTNADLQRGYWIHVTRSAVLKPRLVATVRPDFDAEPIGNFPSKEDADVQDGPLPEPPATRPKRPPHTVENQEYIRFFAGEDVQTLSISNLGDPKNPNEAGGGIMHWRATWKPTTDAPTLANDPEYENWVRLFTLPSEREQRDPNGKLTKKYDSLEGFTTVGNDIIYLRLDRKNLGRGVHTGVLTLETSVGAKVYTVRADIGGLEGDWKGYATIQSVNGKRNPVPDIDLFVSFYEDRTNAGYLRGIVDSSNSVLWPMDVPLVGYRVADVGNQFVLGGGFVLSPGDQNNEPFDQFPDSGDIDFPPPDSLDVRNPYPFPIQRTVSLEGALVRGNPSEGYVIEGPYMEIIHGMTKEPLQLVGRFHLERQSLRPFANRRILSDNGGTQPVVSKGPNQTLNGFSIAAGQSRTSDITINTEMDLQSLLVTLKFASGLPHTNLLIKLQSPSPNSKELILYDGTTPGTSVSAKAFENITFPIDRPFAGSVDDFLRLLEHTKGDPFQKQFWKLSVTNSGTENVSLLDWTLRLEGQPVTDVFGRVLDENNKPVSGATVVLNGLPFSTSVQTDKTGQFVFQRLPLLPLNFSASCPGYLDPAIPGLSNQFTRPFVGSDSLSPQASKLIDQFNPLAGVPAAVVGVPGFTAGTLSNPFVLKLVSAGAGRIPTSTGLSSMLSADLSNSHNVDLHLVPLSDHADTPALNGDSAAGTRSSIPRESLAPGWYHAQSSLPDGAIPYGSAGVVIMPTVRRAPSRPADLGGEGHGLSDPQTANALYTAYCFMPFFAGGGSLPASRESGTAEDLSKPDVYSLSIRPTDIPPTDPPVKATHLTLQHCYCASADIDLAPTGPPETSHAFTSDTFNVHPVGSPFLASDFTGSDNINNQGFKQEDFNYSIVVDPLWNNTRLLTQPQTGAPNLEYPPSPSPIVWGNTVHIPPVDWANESQKSKSGRIFTVANDDDFFDPHPGRSDHPDYLDPDNRVVTHYRMTCFIGGSTVTTLTAPTPSSSVKRAKERRSDPDNPEDPPLVASPPPIARNLYFILHTGGLASQPVPTQESP